MTDYVDAGEAVAFRTLSNVKGQAPATRNVDYERIQNARSEPENWMTYYGTYDGQRYSTLDQINKDTVKRLAPAWVFQAGSTGMHSGASTYSFEASPLVVDGVMYVSGPDGKVWAIDPTTGEELWRYKHASPFDTSLCCGNVNRGVAVGHGRVYMYTLNAHLIALDAQTGELIFDTVNGDVRAGESGSVAPLIVKDMVVVGSAGGEFGLRVKRDEVGVEGVEVHLPVAHGDAAVDVAAAQRDVVRGGVLVAPQLLAGLAVDGPDLALGPGDEHDAVHHERGGLERVGRGTRVQTRRAGLEHPRGGQALDGVLVDLVEPAVTLGVVGAVVRDPVVRLRGRVLDALVVDVADRRSVSLDGAQGLVRDGLAGVHVVSH
jgi:hypothetical protein